MYAGLAILQRCNQDGQPFPMNELARHADVLSVRVVTTWTGRPEAERMGGERIKFSSIIARCSAGFLEYASLRSK